MRDSGRPPAPFEIKTALFVIYALLLTRVALILLALRTLSQGSLPGLRSVLPPILFPLVILFVIVVRRSIRGGRRWARTAYVAYVLVRVALVAALGTFDSLSISYALGYLLIAVLLLSPAATHWFDRMERWRSEAAGTES